MRTMGIFSRRQPRKFAKIDSKYSVSDDGIVWSNGSPLEAIGGVGVNLHGKRVKIAYLVARAFVPNSEVREFVRHKNGDFSDNRAENLEWCDIKEVRGVGRPSEVKVVTAWTNAGEKVGQWDSVKAASEDTGVRAESIRACMSGRQKTAGGKIWR